MPTIPIYGQFESRTVSGALVDCNSVIGGWHIVNTLSDRDTINTGVRKSGMIVYVIENETPYVLMNNLRDWKQLVTENQQLYTIPIGNLTVGNIVLAGTDDKFECVNAVYVVDSSSSYSTVIYSGMVYPTNLPEYTTDTKVYLDTSGNLVTTIVSEGTYKYIGYITSNNDNVGLVLSEMQINYKCI